MRGILTFQREEQGAPMVIEDFILAKGIMMAPNRMVDYVVLHEFCHLVRHDHSLEFWQEMARVMPDYQRCREWLRENALNLNL